MDPFSVFVLAGICLLLLSFAVSFVDDFGSAFFALMAVWSFVLAGIAGLFFILANFFHAIAF